MSSAVESLMSVDTGSELESSLVLERKLFNDKLIKGCQKLKKDDIQEYVVPLLPPEISWDQIKACLRNFKLKFTPRVIGKLIVYLLRKESLDKYKHIVNRVCLLDIALNKKRVWVPFSLLDPVTQIRIKTPEQMEKLCLQAIRIQKSNGDVYATCIDGFIYIMVIFKKLTRKTGVVASGPLIFAVSVNDPYLFTTKQIPVVKLSILIKALGFENCKKHSLLTGRNIQSLVKMLKNKAGGIELPKEIPFVPQTCSGSRADFYLENEERLNHAVHYLGEDTVVLEELSITGPKEFHGDLDRSVGKELKTSMKIQTKDVGYFIKHMAWKGVMKPPFPNYVKQLNVIGKNKMKLKPDHE